MNESEHRSESSAADQMASDLLDHVDHEALAPIGLMTSPVDKNRLADLMWLHALLEQAFETDSSWKEQLISRAINAIREDLVEPEADAIETVAMPVHQAPRRRGSLRIVVSLVAIAMIFCMVPWLQTVSPRKQAQAAVTQIHQAATLAEDREYLVTLSFASLPDTAVPDAARIVEATLFVRGGEAFVAKAPSLLRPGHVWFGRDRNGAWFKPSVGPVISGPAALLMQQRFFNEPAQASTGSNDPPPFLQITSVIDRLAENYDVQLLPNEVLSRDSLSRITVCQHVRGTRRISPSTPSWLPHLVEIHANPKTGTIMRLVLKWTSETQSKLKQIQFDFVQQSKKPDDWYRSAWN